MKHRTMLSIFIYCCNYYLISFSLIYYIHVFLGQQTDTTNDLEQVRKSTPILKESAYNYKEKTAPTMLLKLSSKIGLGGHDYF